MGSEKKMNAMIQRNFEETGAAARTWLSPAELVAVLAKLKVPHTSGTLRNWRSSGRGGPKYHRVGNRVAYARQDIDEWLDQTRFGEDHRRCPRPKAPTAPGETTEQRED
jgi:hypothetical protein